MSVQTLCTLAILTAGLAAGQVVPVPGSTNLKASVVQQRSLYKLMSSDPRAALALIAGSPEGARPFEYRGPVSAFIFDDFDNRRAVVSLRFRDSDGTLVTVYAAPEAAAGLRCGGDVHMKGMRLADRGVISTLTASRAAGTTGCATEGTQRVAAILAAGPGVTPPLDPATVTAKLFGAGAGSSKQLISAVTYGKVDMEGTTFGWFRLSRQYACEDAGAITSEAIAAAEPAGFQVSSFDRVMVVVHSSVFSGACAWGGSGQIGCPLPDPADPLSGVTTLVAVTNDSGETLSDVAAHEFGHNLGLGHSRSVEFPRDSLEADRSRAISQDYGDPYSLMGSGTAHIAASQARELKWLDSSAVQVADKQGAFLLSPVESAAGVRALKIRRRLDNKEQWIWIEYRSALSAFLLRSEDSRTRELQSGVTSEIFAPRLPERDIADFEMEPGSVWSDRHGDLIIETGNPGASGVPVTVRYDTPCAVLSPVTTPVAVPAGGQQITLNVAAVRGCTWAAVSNRAWLGISDEGARTGNAAVTVTIAPNPSRGARYGSVTLARKVVFFRQEGSSPTPGVTRVFPGSSAWNPSDFVMAELAFSQVEAHEEVAEVQVLYNTSQSELNGCLIGFDIKRLRYRMADASGTFGAWLASHTSSTGPFCELSYFNAGTNKDVGVVDYKIMVRVPSPKLFVRFVTQDGRTTAWEQRASYSNTSGCVPAFNTSEYVSYPSGGPLDVFVIAPNGCAWSLASVASWVHVGAASGSGSGGAAISLDPNTSRGDRLARLTAGSRSVVLRQLGSGSLLGPAFSPPELMVPASASTQVFGLAGAPRDAELSFTSSVSWARVLRADPQPIGGPAWLVSVEIDGNAGSDPRIGQISVASATLEILQSGAGATITPPADLIGSGAAFGIASIDTGSASGTWNAVSSATWLRIVEGATGTARGHIRYQAAPNTTKQSRTAWIRAGNAFLVVTQVGAGVQLKTSYTMKPLAGAMGDGYGRPASNLLLDRPGGLAIDAAGNLYVSDRLRRVLSRISPDGIATRVAGNGLGASLATQGAALEYGLSGPGWVAVHPDGSIYVVDQTRCRVHRVDAGGNLTTVAGSGSSGFSGDGGQATAAGMTPMAIAFDQSGRLLISGNHRVRRVEATGVINTIAGTGTAGFSGDLGAAVSAQLNSPEGIYVRSDGALFIADSGNQRVRAVSPAGTISTIAGNGYYGSDGDGGPAVQARIRMPRDVKGDASGNIYIAEGVSIRRVGADGTIGTVAGGRNGVDGDGGPALQAAMTKPHRLAIAATGEIYVGDDGMSGVRRVGSDQIIQRVAGVSDSAGDNAQTPGTRLLDPRSVAVSSAGDAYIVESEGRRVRRISPEGLQTTFAGSGAYSDSQSTGAAGTFAFTSPADVAVLPDGGVLVADRLLYVIRDEAVAPFVTMNGVTPKALAVGPSGTAYVLDPFQKKIYRIDIDAGGTVTVIAGGTSPASNDDGIPAVNAALPGASTVAVDAAGNVYVDDFVASSRRVRRIGTDGLISTIYSGSFNCFALDGDALVTYGPGLGIQRVVSGTVETLAQPEAGRTDGEVPLKAAKVQEIRSLRGAADGRVFLMDPSADRVYVITPRF